MADDNATRRWRHKKHGSEYVEIGRATLQSSTPYPREGEDGRFEEVR